MRCSLLAAGIVLAAFSADAGAAPQSVQRAVRRAPAEATGHGTVGGQGLGTDGQGVGRARGTREASDGRLPKTTETNRQGHFWFPSLATGLYDVRAYSKGRVSDWRKNVWVDRGKQTSVTLRLRSKKPAPGKNPPAPTKP